MSRYAEDRFPRIVRHLALNCLVGVVLGIALAGGLILTNAAGLGALFAGTDTPVAATVLFCGMFGLTFGSLAMGSSIMMLPKGDRFPEE